MITPAISILSAVEGLEVATPVFSPWVVPVSTLILVALFAVQPLGTHRVGRVFGPVMVIWFLTLAALGAAWIARAPQVLGAMDPTHAVLFLREHGAEGFPVLGAVFLVVTGGEALYADMGHFGKRPIRVAWFTLVFPALAINYLGQGARLLIDPSVAPDVFFRLAPSSALLPLVALSTAATIIASQALISGAFSITRQAIQLGYSPRLDVEQTSEREAGQIYIPQVNWLLMTGTIALVVGFGSSSRLAGAYGIAVTMTMVITAVLLPVVAVTRWGWSWPAVAATTALFLAIDLAFFGANMVKFLQGGWVSLAVAAAAFTMMTTWKTGRQLVVERLQARAVPIDRFIAGIVALRPPRVPGTAVFMTGQSQGTPPALAHNVRHNKVVHQAVVILTVGTSRVPHVAADERVTVQPLGHGFYTVRMQFGFMDTPDVPATLGIARDRGLYADLAEVTYFLGRETLIVTGRHGMARWREQLFVLMARNAVRATTYFRLPPEAIVELGVQVEL